MLLPFTDSLVITTQFDPEMSPIIRPVIVQPRVKYPDYEPSDAVKAEIAARPKQP